MAYSGATRKNLRISCLSKEEVMFMESQPSAPSHRRSASDSIAFLVKPFSIEVDIVDCSFYDDQADFVDVTQLHQNLCSDYEMPAFLDSYGPERRISGFNSDMDPRKIKRMLDSRESAQRSRIRKLEAKISLISPQLTDYELQSIMLKKENDEMKEKLELLKIEKASKEAEYQVLKEERDQLNLICELMQEGK